MVIVDAKSHDGTLQVLQKYAKKGSITLIIKNCSRGKGRQIALENSKGQYIISNLDLDDIFTPRLQALIHFYHSQCENRILAAMQGEPRESKWFPNITIGTRNLIEELGGWSDLQWGEDLHLWSRAAKSRRYVWTLFKIVKTVGTHRERQRLFYKNLYRFYKYRDLQRVGRKVFDEKEKVNLNQKLVFAIAKIATLFKSNYHDNFNEIFDPFDLEYYLQYASST